MYPRCIWLVLSLLLACGRAEAIEERKLCWQGVCAGMTLPEVDKRLEAQGFKVHGNWLSRWFQRWLPGNSVNDYDAYLETVSATRDGKCDQVATRYGLSCPYLNLGFVRFPSGRRRLLYLNGADSVPTKRLASEVIADMKAVLGPPDTSEWKKWPEESGGRERWTVWDAHWGGAGNWLTVTINLLEAANVKEGNLLPPDLRKSVHASSVDIDFYAKWIGLEAEKAWRGERAAWSKDPRTGCRVWNNYPNETDTVSWDGPCVNGYASGHGIVRWSEFGREYEVVKGEFRGGKLNGHAVETLSDEVRFEGEFRDNRPEGPGTLERNGETYTGQWSKGCFTNDGRRTAFYTDRDQCDNF